MWFNKQLGSIRRRTINDNKCCAGRLKEFDSKNPAVNIEDAGHDEEMNQDVNDFIDFDEDFSIIIEEKDS